MPDVTAAPPAEVRPEKKPETGALSLDQWFMQMMGQGEKLGEAAAAQGEQALAERSAALEPKRQKLEATVAAPQPEPPMPPPEIKPPTPGIRPFAEGLPGESPAQTLNRTLMSLGLIAQMGVGVAKGNPQGALAAYSGALRGWQEGDTRRGQEQWAEYLAYVNSMQRAWRNAHTIYEDTVRRNEGDIQRAQLELGIAAAKQDEKAESVRLAFQNYQQFMDRAKLAGTMLEKMHQDAAWMSLRVAMQKDQQQFQERLERMRQDERLARDKERREERPVNAPAGGEWYDRKTKERGIATVPQGDINNDPRRFARLSAQEKNLLDFIDTTPPMLNRLPYLAQKILTQYPGQNIANTLRLAAEGKIAASDELREFVSVNRALTVESTRILGGGGQLRVSLMKRLENEVTPRVQDTVSTAMTAKRLMGLDFENRKRGILGEKQLELNDAVGGEWIVTDGKQQRGIRLKNDEVLSESHPGWTVVKPYVAPEQK